MRVTVLPCSFVVFVEACAFSPAGPEPGPAPTGGDAAVGDAVAAAACPDDYAEAPSGGVYARRMTPRSRAAAGDDCDDDLAGRTHLATFEAAADLDGDLAALEVDDADILFIGGACARADCGARGAWFWSTGPAVADELWPPGQPNQGSIQHALAAQHVGGAWLVNNIEAELLQPYVCECDR